MGRQRTARLRRVRVQGTLPQGARAWARLSPPMQIYAEMMPMLQSGTFDVAHLDPWLRGYALAEG
ncbi:hypothetical protein TVNIR_0904 [Thioalkalivibrio nitratireducens DSM 14787]|uniref:Uncharacterized protein n=1 Tax=Thioalkalivibrio nitratireducens (strain DSM 14787 / UNIQEM 213 / ALEN2) TaxID=1255043 RepID=L0DSK5_THIND|nr:hypothetical protein TVNIR_0904 [Thioalkalivibrio nitratireducens DSM 14787]